ncbi:MAG TPA: DUF4129 domain-containing protein [Actinophytocola sp.]|uniref:DUF4129 domain-containing protein n=1 Tax=Actinophytocola sp. TaxID=1872138 RepID=UPI002DBA9DBA|nr:DUF4129 domain-containing protein [Actinophytocola sp.]HEU5476058.1 DUF4129 domain-containing protein [Actinophytocola sp.]
MVPVDVDRDEARDAAVRELSDPAYAAAEPSLLTQVLDWLAERLAGFGLAVPGGPTGLIMLAAAVALIVVAMRLRAGRITRNRAARPELFQGRVRTAADHRRAAAEAAARGELSEAVRERFRAIVRELEQRGVLTEMSGRTVAEIAAAATAALPGSATELSAAAALFDEVIYGGRPATMAGYQRLARLDEAVQRERVVPVPA